MIYFLCILIFLTIFIFICGLFMQVLNKEKVINKLQYYDDDYVIKEKIEKKKKSNLKIVKTLSTLIPDIKGNINKRKKVEEDLVKADIDITSEELLVIKVLSSAAVTFLGYSISKDLVITFLVFLIVWNIPKVIIIKRKKDKMKKFNEQINEGIIIISNSLKAGYSFLQAVAVVVEETSDPFSKEFKKALKEMSLGVSIEDALKGMIKRVDSEDLHLMINTILIQNEIGGNLSEILDNISDTIRERQKIYNELKTLTAQGKLSGMIISSMPVFLGITIYLFNKEYILLLFTTNIGLAMIISSLISQVFGIFMIKKIVTIDM